MGVLNIIGGNKNTNIPIIETLLATQPLTARQIYFKLKKLHGLPISYQAVHKRLQALEKEGVLKKDSLEYSLNPEWFDRIDEFSMLVKNRLKKREHLLNQLKRKEVIFEKKHHNIKVVSFDLGGAIFNNQFDELLWRTEIPRIYAAQYNLSKEEGFERVTNEYRRLWGKVDNWRDPNFWLKHFKLNTNFNEVIKNIKKEIIPYIDASPILKILSKEYHLIVTSHAQENILMTKLKIANYQKYFLKVFSTGSDFNKMTKDKDIYKEICEILNIRPEEMVHVGNDFDLDYKIPSSIGVNAFLIDRIGRKKEHFVVRDLYEFEEKIKEIEAM